MSKSQEWDAEKGAHKQSEKNACAVTRVKDGKKFSFAMASDAFKQGASGNLYNDDWKVDGALALEQKPAKKEWKGKGTLAVSSPLVADKIRLWLNVSRPATYTIITPAPPPETPPNPRL